MLSQVSLIIFGKVSYKRYDNGKEPYLLMPHLVGVLRIQQLEAHIE